MPDVRRTASSLDQLKASSPEVSRKKLSGVDRDFVRARSFLFAASSSSSHCSPSPPGSRRERGMGRMRMGMLLLLLRCTYSRLTKFRRERGEKRRRLSRLHSCRGRRRRRRMQSRRLECTSRRRGGGRGGGGRDERGMVWRRLRSEGRRTTAERKNDG